jgi:hypothetical protein
MGTNGAVKWQPTWVLQEAYSVALEAMTSGRLWGPEALNCYDYLRDLEGELIRRGVVDDLGVSVLLAVVEQVLEGRCVRVELA